jgi:hypothetical protein
VVRFNSSLRFQVPGTFPLKREGDPPPAIPGVGTHRNIPAVDPQNDQPKKKKKGEAERARRRERKAERAKRQEGRESKKAKQREQTEQEGRESKKAERARRQERKAERAKRRRKVATVFIIKINHRLKRINDLIIKS